MKRKNRRFDGHLQYVNLIVVSPVSLYVALLSILCRDTFLLCCPMLIFYPLSVSSLLRVCRVLLRFVAAYRTVGKKEMLFHDDRLCVFALR
jgi:hypothetical protein